MREIKFRAWNKFEESFVDSNEYAVTFNGIIFKANLDSDTYNNLISNENLKLMQYTGLKDKNGKYIYEGDILQSTDKKENEKNKWIGVVEDNNFEWLALKYKEYLNPSWLGALSSPINEPQTATWISSMCEVIGNIYENPELLRED